MRERRTMPYAAAEAGFDYRPRPQPTTRTAGRRQVPRSLRYPAPEFRFD